MQMPLSEHQVYYEIWCGCCKEAHLFHLESEGKDDAKDEGGEPTEVRSNVTGCLI
jgi:hypothetical protein